MKLIKLTKKEQQLIWSLLKPYSEGISSLSDKKGNYFIGIDDIKFYDFECNKIIKKLDV